MMERLRKVLLGLWTVFSAALCFFFLFRRGDELLTRRECLFVILISAACGMAAVFIARKITSAAHHAALLISLLLSLGLCLWLERNHPQVILPPQDTVLEIETTQEAPLTLTWAYWSQPNQAVSDELNEWHRITDIRSGQLMLSGDWLKGPDVYNICSGKCSAALRPDVHFSRPVFCFEGTAGETSVRVGADLYEPVPNGTLILFLTNAGLSRQMVFALFLLCCWGVLYLAPGGLLCILRPLKWEKKDDLPTALLLLMAFLVPLIILTAVCYLLRIWPFGEKTFLITDMQVQYVDYLLYLKQILHGDRSLFYAFAKSIGDDFLSLYAYYLGNPLNWIAALFPVRFFPAAVNLLVVIRYGLCGLASALYFRRSFHTKGETLIFSTAYALISLQFVIGEHIQLRDGAILLPLVLLGIDRLISEERSGLYILSLGTALLVNYYSAYQICFFCVVYFLFRVFLRGSLTFRPLIRFLAASLASALLCAAFLIPVALQLTKGMKTFDAAQFTLSFNMRLPELLGKLFNGAFDQGQTLTSGFPNIFCGLLITTGIPVFFLNRSISLREKLLTAAVLVLFYLSMQIRALNLILHGFNEPVWWPYRYSFIVCLFMITVVLRCYRERAGIRTAGLLASAVLTLAALFYVQAQHFSWFTRDAFCLNLLLVLCMLILWTASASSELRSLILVLSAVDLFLNGWMILGDKTAYQRSETVRHFQQFFGENIPVIEALNDYDGDFYRTEKTYSRDANDAMTLGYYGVGHYSSTLNYSLMKFLPKIGYRYYPWRFLYAEGSDPAADSLLGIRYIISDGAENSKPYPQVMSVGEKVIYQNPYSLPIAFVGEDVHLTDGEETAFDLQNGIFRALTGNAAPIYHRLEPQAVSGADAEINLHFSDPAGTLHYLYILSDTDDQPPIDVYLDGIYLTEYFDGRGVPIIPLPTEEDQNEWTLTLKPLSGRISPDDVLVVSQDLAVLEADAVKLRESSLSLQKNSDTSLSGEIAAYSDGYLIFSIPYDKGWTVIVDGKKAVPEAAFNIFLSAPVTQGEHTYAIRYLPDGLKEGCAVSAAAALVLCLVGIRKKSASGNRCRGFRAEQKESVISERPCSDE